MTYSVKIHDRQPRHTSWDRQLMATALERFWARVDVGGPDECWPWNGYRGPRGYGQLSFRGRHVMAHRVAIDALDVPEIVMHSCDNPPCCNPSHLSLGTRADNNRDMTLKGRVQAGSAKHMAKLTEEQVREIRSLVEAGCKQQDVADQYGVTQQTVSRMVNRRTWKQVA